MGKYARSTHRIIVEMVNGTWYNWPIGYTRKDYIEVEKNKLISHEEIADLRYYFLDSDQMEQFLQVMQGLDSLL